MGRKMALKSNERLAYLECLECNIIKAQGVFTLTKGVEG